MIPTYHSEHVRLFGAPLLLSGRLIPGNHAANGQPEVGAERMHKHTVAHVNRLPYKTTLP